MKEIKNLNVTFTKSGSGSTTTRLALPITWLRELSVTEDDRNVEVTLDRETKTITIEKK